jgi:hypothetical protein
MHSYCRGARSHVAVKCAGCIRKACHEEVDEHGRWRRKRSNLPMALPSLRDRVAINGGAGGAALGGISFFLLGCPHLQDSA